MNETCSVIAPASFDENERQHAKVAGMIKCLESSVAAAENTGKRLPQAIGAAVDAREEAAAQQAAAATASNWTGPTAQVERAAAMYRREADTGPRKIRTLSLIAIGLGLAVIVPGAWMFCRRELGRLRTEVATLEEIVRRTERKGDCARLAVQGLEEARAAVRPG